MNNYITVADLVPDYFSPQVYAQYVSDNGSGIPTVNIDEIIAKQQSEIDQALQVAGYVVPMVITVEMPSYPRLIKRYLCEMVRYQLMARRGMVTQPVKDEYERIIGDGTRPGFLELIATRKKSIGIGLPTPPQMGISTTNKCPKDASMTLKKTREAGFPLPGFAASLPVPGGND